MKNSVELKQERASLKDKQTALVNRAKKENREMTDAENTEFDGYMSDRSVLDSQIIRAEQIELDSQRDASSGAGVVVGAEVPVKSTERFSIAKMIRNAAEGVTQRSVEQSLIDQANEELRANGKEVVTGKRIALPANMLFRAQSVTGDLGAKGGKLVASNPEIVMPLLSSLTLQNMGAKVYDNLVGDVPLISGSDLQFSYVSENGSAPESDADYDGAVLSAKRLSGVVKISNRLLAQTSPSAEQNIYDLIGQGINAEMVRAAIGGSADGPTGLYDSIANVQAGVSGAPTWEDVVGLETLIKSSNATKENLYYLSDPSLMGKLKTTKKDAGSGIYLVGENGLLNGKNYLDTTLAPTLDAGASHPLIYGDFKQMAIGFWTGVQMTIDPYTLAAEGYTRVIFNVYNDVQLANPKAFAVRKNFTV